MKDVFYSSCLASLTQLQQCLQSSMQLINVIYIKLTVEYLKALYQCRPFVIYHFGKHYFRGLASKCLIATAVHCAKVAVS